MTIQEFIIEHPNQRLDLMTPGGYVYLTPEKAQLLLDGKNVSAHPGHPEYSRQIEAAELLNQSVCSANFSNGEWHILSDYPEEPQNGQMSAGQEVTMCWKS